MVGFMGQKFDFTGGDGVWYCLIKDPPTFQMNMVSFLISSLRQDPRECVTRLQTTFFCRKTYNTRSL